MSFIPLVALRACTHIARYVAMAPINPPPRQRKVRLSECIPPHVVLPSFSRRVPGSQPAFIHLTHTSAVGLQNLNSSTDILRFT